MYSSVWLEPLQNEKNLNIVPLVKATPILRSLSGMSESTIGALQSARERPRKNSLSTEVQRVSSKNPQELLGRQESFGNKKSP
jgi:hypothetical protein